jgi:hypothetical protein
MVAADMAAHAAQWISSGQASAADLDRCIQQLTSSAKAAMGAGPGPGPGAGAGAGAGAGGAVPPMPLSWRDWIPSKLTQWNAMLGHKAGGADGAAAALPPGGAAAAAAAAAAGGSSSRKRSAAVLLEESEDDAYGAPGSGAAAAGAAAGAELPEPGAGPFSELGAAPPGGPPPPPLPAQIFPASASFPAAAPAAAPAAVPPRGPPAFSDLDLQALELDLDMGPDDGAPAAGPPPGDAPDAGAQPPPEAVRQVIDDIMRRVREMWVARRLGGWEEAERSGPRLPPRARGCQAMLPACAAPPCGLPAAATRCLLSLEPAPTCAPACPATRAGTRPTRRPPTCRWAASRTLWCGGCRAAPSASCAAARCPPTWRACCRCGGPALPRSPACLPAAQLRPQAHASAATADRHRHCRRLLGPQEFYADPSVVYQTPEHLQAAMTLLAYRDLQVLLAYTARQHADAMALQVRRRRWRWR